MTEESGTRMDEIRQGKSSASVSFPVAHTAIDRRSIPKAAAHRTGNRRVLRMITNAAASRAARARLVHRNQLMIDACCGMR